MHAGRRPGGKLLFQEGTDPRQGDRWALNWNPELVFQRRPFLPGRDQDHAGPARWKVLRVLAGAEEAQLAHPSAAQIRNARDLAIVIPQGRVRTQQLEYLLN